MPAQPPTTLMDHFAKLEDPRDTRRVLHHLSDITVMAVCAVIAGAEGWTDVELFSKSREAWFKKFLDLPEGVPSHDTFRRVFSLVAPSAFERCFTSWMQCVADLSKGEFLAVDGKTVRRSMDRRRDRSAIHMVSAWACKNRVVLGQVKTEEKSNEITAIPKLLETLTLTGCIVTIDAMGCQKTIAEQVIEQQGDYVLALKGNHSKLHEDVESFFEETVSIDFTGVPHSCNKTADAGHGRREARRDFVVEAEEWLEDCSAWRGLESIVMVESERHGRDRSSLERRFYISSLPFDSPKIAEAIRIHWGVENGLHWVLDVTFNEDQCCIRDDRGAEAMSVLRRIALNLITKAGASKLSVRAQRKKAGWDNRYLERMISSIIQYQRTSGA